MDSEKARAWEAKCRRCGRCCYEKIEFCGQVYYTDVPCEWLDPATRLCTIYERRHRVRSGCAPLTPKNVAAGILPADCPYVAGIKDYAAPVLWEEDEKG